MQLIFDSIHVKLICYIQLLFKLNIIKKVLIFRLNQDIFYLCMFILSLFNILLTSVKLVDNLCSVSIS